MNHFKQATLFYKEHFKKILLVSLAVVFPIQFIHFVLVNTIDNVYSAWLLPPFFSTLMTGFFALIAASMVQLPFIKMVVDFEEEGAVNVRAAFGTTAYYLFCIYVMGILYATGVVIGSLLFLIPGVLVFVFLYAFPYAAVMEDRKWFKGIKRAISFGKKHFFVLLAWLFIFLCIEFMIQFIALFGLIQITTLAWPAMLLHMLLNMMFVPWFTFIIAYYYLDWIGGLEEREDWYINNYSIR